MISIKTSQEIDFMKQGGQILATVLRLVERSVKVGISTKQLADIARDEVYRLGAEPAFLNYSGFPDVICISVNDQVVHGLPGSYLIKSGDVVSFDFGVKYKGLITDAARTVLVDSNNKLQNELVTTTKRALDEGINVLKNGVRLGNLSSTIQKVLEDKGFGVVRALVGHGVGYGLHEEPEVPNYGQKGTGIILKTGMTIAIEPMSTVGSYDVYTAADGWAVLTKDKSDAAHFEDTVVITDDGAEILTRL